MLLSLSVGMFTLGERNNYCDFIARDLPQWGFSRFKGWGAAKDFFG